MGSNHNHGKVSNSHRNAKRILTKSLSYAFAGGAVLAIGLLSFAGMFMFSSSILWCCTAFALSAAYESQVYKESVFIALTRMFDEEYLKQAIILRNLNELLENFEELAENARERNNIFLADFYKQKKYLSELTKIISPSEEQLLEIKSLQKELHRMEKLFIAEFNNQEKKKEPSELQKSMQALITLKKEKIETEIANKAWFLKMSWVFAIGGGVSSGLATLSAMKLAIAAFSFSFAVPGGALIALSALAAVGYTLLLYQTFAEIVQAYHEKWPGNFNKRKDESHLGFGLRSAATLALIGLAVVVTIATAGTWWIAAKHGASLIGLVDKGAALLRTISVAIMALPNFIFNTYNSANSVDKISRSDYKLLYRKTVNEINSAYENESIYRFVNPFRFFEKVISYSASSILFLGHVVSMSLISDRSTIIGAKGSVAAGTICETAVDANFLPDEKHHNHASLLLKALFLPVKIVEFTLKGFATLWDSLSTGSLTQSFNHIFHPKPALMKPNNNYQPPKPPELSEAWRSQQRLLLAIGHKRSSVVSHDDHSPANRSAPQDIPGKKDSPEPDSACSSYSSLDSEHSHSHSHSHSHR